LDKEETKCGGVFKIAVNGKTFHLLMKWRVTSKMM